jgi:hypothetical protein
VRIFLDFSSRNVFPIFYERKSNGLVALQTVRIDEMIGCIDNQLLEEGATNLPSTRR